MNDISITSAASRVQQIFSMAEQMQSFGRPQQTTSTGFAQQLATAQAVAPAASPAAGLDSLTSGTPATPALAAATPAATASPVAANDPQMAAKLDAWMAQHTPGSPLIGMGSEFVAAAQRHGLDPRFLVAVAAQESGLGTAGSGKDIHNAFGWGPAIPFASWQENIETVAAGLAKGYLGEGRDTIAAIQGKWAPVGAANDPGGLNSNWTTGVSKFYAEMGGSPAGSVRA